MRRTAVLLAAIAAASFGPAYASGFYINEQSARGLGRGFAGEVALGGDAAALWYNPALALDAARPTATLAVSGVFTDARLTDRGSSLSGPGQTPTRPVGGAPIGDDPLDPAAIPLGAAILPISDRAALGVSVNVPFGLVVDYPDGFFGRYDSTRTELLTINLQASAALRLDDRLWVGAGMNAQHAEAALENALPNLVPGAPDGFAQVVGDDWSLGWNVGALWRPNDRLRVGASYRSAIEHRLEGRQQVRGLLGPLAAANGQVAGAADLDLPAIAMIGAAFEASPGWTLMAQLDWFEWSNFEEIRVRSPGRPDAVRPQNYRDALTMSVGMERRISDRATWRVGAMREETPTRSGFRSTRVPDSDRNWLTAGLSWTPAARATLDVGLAYVDLENAPVERQDVLYEATPAQLGYALRSEIDGDAVIASLGATLRF